MVKISRLLFLLIILNFFLRTFNLHHPEQYIFDEVYHAFTANAYRHNDPRGYEWWHQSETKGTAYEWLHPPLSKLFMAGGIYLFGNNSFGWRISSSIFGTLTIFFLFLLGKALFNQRVALLACFLFTFEGLVFVQSRIAMNDIFLTAWLLLASYFFVLWFQKSKKKYLLLSGIITGLAISTKWPGVFVLPLFFLFLAFRLKKKFSSFLKKNSLSLLVSFLIIPLLIYFLSFLQFFFQGHSLKTFYQLHQQIWWYQTNLKATHSYQSRAYTWPLMWRPVWFYVNYQKEKIANIYALGNPLIFWGGLLVLPFALFKAFVKKSKPLVFTLLAYFLFWVPWIASPRIMFLYHYLPSIPFLCLILGWQLERWFKDKKRKRFWAIIYLALVVLCFAFFYPHLTGLLVPKNLNRFYYWLPSWK